MQFGRDIKSQMRVNADKKIDSCVINQQVVFEFGGREKA